MFVYTLNYNFAAYALQKAYREIYVLEHSVKWAKQQVDDRMRVVIPTTIADLARRGQYHSNFRFLLL